MNSKHTAPVTQKEALKMISPLDPAQPKNAFTPEEKEVSFSRLVEFIRSLLPE